MPHVRSPGSCFPPRLVWSLGLRVSSGPGQTGTGACMRTKDGQRTGPEAPCTKYQEAPLYSEAPCTRYKGALYQVPGALYQIPTSALGQRLGTGRARARLNECADGEDAFAWEQARTGRGQGTGYWRGAPYSGGACTKYRRRPVPSPRVSPRVAETRYGPGTGRVRARQAASSSAGQGPTETAEIAPGTAQPGKVTPRIGRIGDVSGPGAGVAPRGRTCLLCRAGEGREQAIEKEPARESAWAAVRREGHLCQRRASESGAAGQWAGAGRNGRWTEGRRAVQTGSSPEHWQGRTPRRCGSGSPHLSGGGDRRCGA